MKKFLFKNRTGPDKAYHFQCTEFLKDKECCLFIEDYFHEMIYLERKRSERSGKPFVLMLLGIERLHREREFYGIVKRMAHSVHSLTRETDIKGWYRNNSEIGVIFTETGAKEVSPIKEKVCRALEDPQMLGQTLLQMVDVSFHVFPEERDEKEKIPFDLKLYPDISRKSTVLKRSLLIKRIMDIGGSLFGLAFFSPFFLSIALLIKLSSRGPVFFRQKRIGAFGTPFVLLKFRSMYADNDENIHNEYVKKLILEQKAYTGGDAGKDPDGTVYKIKDDPRVTPLGRLLRKTSLDELPQFINVLMGEMSLVGPRPPIPYEFEHYDIWHRRRVREAKPGITGVWQVEGRSKTTFNDMVRMDLRYINGWSPWLDLKLIMQTPWSMLTSRGAY